MESHAKLSGKGTVQNPRVLEQGNPICFRDLFTIQKAALGLLVSLDRDRVPNYGRARDYYMTTHHEQGLTRANNL